MPFSIWLVSGARWLFIVINMVMVTQERSVCDVWCQRPFLTPAYSSWQIEGVSLSLWLQDVEKPAWSHTAPKWQSLCPLPRLLSSRDLVLLRFAITSAATRTFGSGCFPLTVTCSDQLKRTHGYQHHRPLTLQPAKHSPTSPRILRWPGARREHVFIL